MYDMNLLSILSLLLLVLYLFWKFISSCRGSKLPPGPHLWHTATNLSTLSKEPHLFLTKMAELYGPLVSLRLGTKLVVIGSSSAAAMEILRTQDRLLSGRYLPRVGSRIPNFVNSTLSLSEECSIDWKNLRSICQTSIFSSKAVKLQAQTREKKMMDMVNYLEKKEGKTVKIDDLLYVVSANSMSNVLVSRDIIEFEDEVKSKKMKSFVNMLIGNAAVPTLSDINNLFEGIDVWGKKNSVRVEDAMVGFWEEIINDRRDGKTVCNSQDLLGALIANDFCNNKISFLLTEMLIAGMDTTRVSIEWVMAELMKNPDIMQKLQKELSGVINGEEVLGQSHLTNLTYLKACVKESLRLHPPQPFLVPHYALQTTEVMNYMIPKDSLVIVNIWAIGHDPKSWDEPFGFKPERFLDSSLDFKGTHFEFIPFSSGRRICPGLPVAVPQVQLAVAFLVHCFDWFLPHGIEPNNLDMKEKFGVPLKKEEPLLLIPRRRHLI